MSKSLYVNEGMGSTGRGRMKGAGESVLDCEADKEATASNTELRLYSLNMYQHHCTSMKVFSRIV